MKSDLTPEEVHRLAYVELNLFHLANILPGLNLEGARIGPGTPMHMDGEDDKLLFYRFPLLQESSGKVGYADVAAQTFFGSPLLAVSGDIIWDPQMWLAEARTAFELLAQARSERTKRLPEYDEVRFVAFSFPKLAVQFLAAKKELLMLELGTWNVVPKGKVRRHDRLENGGLERWSLLDGISLRKRRSAHKRFTNRARLFGRLNFRAQGDPDTISRNNLPASTALLRLHDIRNLHYSVRSANDHACFELRAQTNDKWCVAASVQMVLDFYRYQYPQTIIGCRLNLGTDDKPETLPPKRNNCVTDQLGKMSSDALTAEMLVTPAFSDYITEIRANRPLINFIKGHSRAVAGYTRVRFLTFRGGDFRGLLIHDPWPVNVGDANRWENYDAYTYCQSYVCAFTARVQTVNC